MGTNLSLVQFAVWSGDAVLLSSHGGHSRLSFLLLLQDHERRVVGIFGEFGESSVLECSRRRAREGRRRGGGMDVAKEQRVLAKVHVVAVVDGGR